MDAVIVHKAGLLTTVQDRGEVRVSEVWHARLGCDGCFLP